MIEVKNVSKSYRKSEKFIEKMNFKVDDGKIICFIGPNGAGKTTMIKMITGILKMDKGDILIDNKSISKESLEAKKMIGYVSDTPDNFLQLKGFEYLNFVADMYEVPKKEREERIKKIAKIFKIYDRLDEKIFNYSHGMRQKINIIAALIHNPKNLILDEPLTGLDPESCYYFKKILKEYVKNGNCVFFSTHILEVAEKICDEIIIINNGKLVLKGNYKDIIEEFDREVSLEDLFIKITNNKTN